MLWPQHSPSPHIRSLWSALTTRHFETTQACPAVRSAFKPCACGHRPSHHSSGVINGTSGQGQVSNCHVRLPCCLVLRRWHVAGGCDYWWLTIKLDHLLKSSRLLWTFKVVDWSITTLWVRFDNKRRLELQSEDKHINRFRKNSLTFTQSLFT